MATTTTTQSSPDTQPSFGTKLLFWLLLGALSVILAEVVSFSAPFAFFDGWGLVVVYPLYTVHVLVLASLIFRSHRVSLQILFLAGAVLGMYEAYVTKVLWNPTWGQDMQLTFGGVYVLQTAILVLFWHPLMAFMLPIIAAERFFTNSAETSTFFPARLRQHPMLTLGLFAIYCGMYQGITSPSFAISFLSVGGAALVFMILAFIWQRLTREHSYSLRMLLPSNKQAIVLTVILLISYGVQTIFLRPEALPQTLIPHVTIWVMYLILFTLLYRNIKQSPTFEAKSSVK